MMNNSQTITDSSPLANFLLKLNVAQSAVIVVDNARPTALDRELIVASLAQEPQEESGKSQAQPPQDTTVRPYSDVPVGKKLRRRVSFDYKVRVATCSALTNIDELFYTKNEYKNMKKDIKATLRRHTQKEGESSSDDESVHCMRGLEAYFGDAKTAKHRARLHACLAVLTEQNRQYMEDGNMIPLDEQELSRRYQQVSLECQREAMQRGMKDCVTIFPASLKCKRFTSTQTYGYDIGAPFRPKFRAVSTYAA